MKSGIAILILLTTINIVVSTITYEKVWYKSWTKLSGTVVGHHQIKIVRLKASKEAEGPVHLSDYTDCDGAGDAFVNIYRFYNDAGPSKETNIVYKDGEESLYKKYPFFIPNMSGEWDEVTARKYIIWDIVIDTSTSTTVDFIDYKIGIFQCNSQFTQFWNKVKTYNPTKGLKWENSSTITYIVDTVESSTNSEICGAIYPLATCA
eukprot:CAMPEP_0170518404 /NCGR_PEP_ID=MMETSP0209-20121228/4106_1 /TAXON_ID=665100 ORGANISM="Litonotus pictus, Strain P1" /NCGR_SAMPLE_ID=MMETSP0209 /ASSEMBLY_ACC=CAM_ASM_000301 /LENGTH=205 /DNA_ID=CAMNT_0010803951 /DNA_START=1 /DNA_END=618 /DNA_ORIENTATION=+